MEAKTKDKITKTATKTVNKAGSYVKKHPMTVVYVGGAIFAMYITYQLFKGISEAGKGVSEAGKIISGENIDSNIEVSLNINPANLSITQEQAKIFASQLLTAMNWKIFAPFAIHGTDNDAVKNVFSKINPEDFKLIYNEFGMKHYNGFGSPPENIIGGIHDFAGVATERDLVFWLKKEINPFWDKTLYKKVKSIVEPAGFAF